MNNPNPPPHCLRCGAPLTFAAWFSGDCPQDPGSGILGHMPSIPGVLLPITLSDAAGVAQEAQL